MSETIGTAEQLGALAGAVCEVMKVVKHAPRDGENKFHGYKYATAEGILAELQPELAKNGLAILPIGCTFATVEAGQTAKGKINYRTDLVMRYLLLHKGGGGVQLEMGGAGIDGEDKGLYKSLTGAAKYLMCQTFAIPRMDDDPDKEEKDNSSETPQNTGAPAVKPPGRPPISNSGVPVKPVIESKEVNGKMKHKVANWEMLVDGEGCLLVIPFGTDAGKPIATVTDKEIDSLANMAMGKDGNYWTSLQAALRRERTRRNTDDVPF